MKRIKKFIKKHWKVLIGIAIIIVIFILKKLHINTEHLEAKINKPEPWWKSLSESELLKYCTDKEGNVYDDVEFVEILRATEPDLFD